MLQSIFLFLHTALFSLSGTITDQETGKPVESAQVVIAETQASTVTGSDGTFSFGNLPNGTYTLKILSIGYTTASYTIIIKDNDQTLSFSLTPVPHISEEIIISAIRADDETPVSKTELSKKQIQEKYFGYDIPYVLNNTPSVNAYSDAGVGIGYSYFRLRGIDQTRINMTINGIPVNDPENHGYYFNNFADMASSSQSIQLQRGVGTSTNGSASIAGSINLLTNNLSDTANAGVHIGYGSYNSSRTTVEFNTGIVNKKLAFYGRVSNIHSDGYRYHSGANIKSYFFSAAKYGKRSVVKMNVFGGYANSELSYIGIDKATLESDRKTNPLTESEKDYFNQNFFQLQYSYEFNDKLNLASSAYFVSNKGWFDVRFVNYPYALMNMPDVTIKDTTITATDFNARYWLKQQFGGAFAYLNYHTHKWNVYGGIHANRFVADHYMTIPWARIYPPGLEPDHEAYFNTGYKNDLSVFAKATYKINTHLSLFGDLQLRNTSFQYKGEDKPIYRDTFQVENMNWVFLNPKVGLRYTFNERFSFYASIGKTSREPTRIDYLYDDRAVSDVKQSDVKPERVIDMEIGSSYKRKNISVLGNIYFMQFRNEIVQTGQFNAFGYPLRKNAASSFRRGIELEASWKVSKHVTLFHALNISYNRIKEFNQFYTVYDAAGNYLGDTSIQYKNVQPVFTPPVTLNQGIRVEPVNGFYVEAIGKYISRSFMDNSNASSLMLPSFWFIDLRASVKLNRWLKSGDYTLTFQANNITNNLYSHAGSVSVYGYALTNDGGNVSNTTVPYYFPAAPRNFFVTLSMKF